MLKKYINVLARLVSIRAVNIEAITPKDKVIEKPLIGPRSKDKQ